ncbi:Protein GVQW1 [Plecturocebus cupreus]
MSQSALLEVDTSGTCSVGISERKESNPIAHSTLTLAFLPSLSYSSLSLPGQGLSLSPKLECSGTIMAHCSQDLPASKTGFCHVAQAGLKFLSSRDLLASASQSAGITGVCHQLGPYRVSTSSSNQDFPSSWSQWGMLSLPLESGLACDCFEQRSMLEEMLCQPQLWALRKLADFLLVSGDAQPLCKIAAAEMMEMMEMILRLYGDGRDQVNPARQLPLLCEKLFCTLQERTAMSYHHQKARRSQTLRDKDKRWGFHHVGQAGLELLSSSDPLASASQSAGITGVSRHTWPECSVLLVSIPPHKAALSLSVLSKELSPIP